MHFIFNDNNLISVLNLLVYFWLTKCRVEATDGLFLANTSIGSSVGFNQTNESKEADLLILSSWQTLMYWTSNSSPHSSKVMDNFEDLNFNKNGSNSLKINAIELFRNQTNCRNVLIWSELTTHSIYSSHIYLKDGSLHLKETKKLLSNNFGSYIKLAVDLIHKNIYLSSYELSRIDLFDIQNQVLKQFLPNISHPVDIAIDSDKQILFWIENWLCVCQMSIIDTTIVRFCSTTPRALAIDPLNGVVFWSDSFGTIFQRKYFESEAQIVISTKKMQNNKGLSITPGAIYLSDPYKIIAINRSTLQEKVVLIESISIPDFISIDKKQLCESLEEEERPEQNRETLTINSNVINNSPFNQSLINDLISNITFSSNQNKTDLFVSNTNTNSVQFYFIIISVLIIVFILILLTIIGFKKFFNKNHRKRNQIKRISARNSNRFIFNDENRLLNKNKDNGKSVCIEDLGSFSNNGYLDPQTFCSNCPIRQTCSSCDDREECIEKGICLTTYKLLT